ncbi:MAG: YHYH protein [Bacteroidetes bacterium]|nr:YHYH protein [Bacteroidota bacterium]MBU1371105.1 YHYH protein [Bacteroidota bacterium]MBU1486013.1 YHYH protein [Bacteroidota bacterium]MBU1759392.1 YHYH protein [Bacteroidota bacterium]MBU2267614.1 YHYH protein [Bacteroidota bacterium]
MKNTFLFLMVFAGSIIISSCKKSSTTITTGTSGTSTVPDIYKKIYGATSITSDGTYIYIKSNGMPDHKSVYYASSNTLYENFTGTTFGNNKFAKNPNNINSQSLTFKIPLNPTVASNHSATPLGPIGVALNGVPIFNQYAGPNQPLTGEIASFDQWWGHPQMSGQYHYHVEPLYLTTVKATKSSLLGFLLDGFPVYGPQENGQTVNNSMLDAYHGHTTVTADYPNGFYHYHITDTDPYINGSGFYGTAGTVSN